MGSLKVDTPLFPSTIEPSKRSAEPHLLPSSRPIIRFVSVIEQCQKTVDDYNQRELELTYEDISEQQRILTQTMRRTAEKAASRESYSYYATVASALLASSTLASGLALMASGTAVPAVAGAAMCGTAAATIYSMCAEGSDSILASGIALATAGLALVASRLGFVANVAEPSKLIGGVALGALSFVQAFVQKQKLDLDSELELLSAEKALRNFVQKEKKTKASAIHEECAANVQTHTTLLEAARQMVEEEQACIRQILVEVQG